jgi:hypothetical protein
MDIILRKIHGWLAVESWKVNKADINLVHGTEGRAGIGARPAAGRRVGLTLDAGAESGRY